jgi:hypothetical protein
MLARCGAAPRGLRPSLLALRAPRALPPLPPPVPTHPCHIAARLRSRAASIARARDCNDESSTSDCGRGPEGGGGGRGGLLTVAAGAAIFLATLALAPFPGQAAAFALVIHALRGATARRRREIRKSEARVDGVAARLAALEAMVTAELEELKRGHEELKRSVQDLTSTAIERHAAWRRWRRRQQRRRRRRRWARIAAQRRWRVRR